ncbi:MAG: hypothetical protein PHT07_11050 [Paludibacter sp.]|nr:hypothetical protein [Paludibacter sp.]
MDAYTLRETVNDPDLSGWEVESEYTGKCLASAYKMKIEKLMEHTAFCC